MYHSLIPLDCFFSLLFTVSTTTICIHGALAVNVLVSSPGSSVSQTMNLTARQYLNVSHFYLVMQPDCNMVTYNGSTPFLTTNLTDLPRSDGTVGPIGPSSTRNCYATMQADSNFVVYQILNDTSTIALWDFQTYKFGYNYRYLVLQRNGSMGAYESDGTPVGTRKFIPFDASRVGAPSPAPAMSQNATSNLTYLFPPELAWKPSLSLDGYPYMPAEYFLSQGSKLQTLNGNFILMLGHDCKLQSQEVWKVNNSMKRMVWDPQRSMAGAIGGDCQLRLQQDGLLEVRDSGSNVVYWNSSVRRDDTVTWVLKVDEDDGHVSVSDILDSTNVLWRSPAAQERASLVWQTVVGVSTGLLFLAMAAAIAFWFSYIRPRLLDPSEKAFRRRLQSIGGKSLKLSEAKVKKATDNFRKKIGYGGFGDVFYGKLVDGQEIAAKVLTPGSHQSKEEFYNEIELLSVVHHKYLVSLLGYSCTWKHQVLIYEYMGGGDLRHRLQGNGAATNPLSWRQRTSTTLQIAEGLEYLHDKCSPAIIHRDVKSNNILLTTDFLVAKVADFGLSKLRRKDQENATHITTVVKGTPGYLDPEYHETGLLTEKSDVYAFGIVLMEILTGQHQMSISQGVSEARRSGQLDDLADPNLGGDFNRDEFVSLVELSLWCVRKSNLRRPYMREVVQKLREIGITPLESMQHEDSSGEYPGRHKHVMRFGIDFEHSEADSQDVLSFREFS